MKSYGSCLSLTGRLVDRESRVSPKGQGGGGYGVEGLSLKEKGLMDTDNSVVIAGGRGEYKGIKQE